MPYARVVVPPPPEAPVFLFTHSAATAAPAPAPTAPLPVALLAHFDGDHGSTAFVDSSGEAHTLTTGGTAKLTTAFSKFGGSSLDLSSAGNNFVVTENTSRFNLLGNRAIVTVEGWVYPKAATSTGTLMALASTYKTAVGGWHCGLVSNGAGYSLFFSDGTSADKTFTASIAVGEWSHFAFSGSMAAMLAFVGGVQKGVSTSWTGPFVGGDALRIGGVANGTKLANVYLDDLRITIPQPVYLAAFTPPVGAYPNP